MLVEVNEKIFSCFTSFKGHVNALKIKIEKETQSSKSLLERTKIELMKGEAHATKELGWKKEDRIFLNYVKLSTLVVVDKILDDCSLD